MQCEVCSEAAIVQITTVSSGKPSERWLCERHAVADGQPTHEEWKSFWSWALPHFKAHGALPPLDQISKQGVAGQWVARAAQRSGSRYLQKLEAKACQLIGN